MVPGPHRPLMHQDWIKLSVLSAACVALGTSNTTTQRDMNSPVLQRVFDVLFRTGHNSRRTLSAVFFIFSFSLHKCKTKNNFISSNFSKFYFTKIREQSREISSTALQCLLDYPRLFHDGGKTDQRKFRVVPHKYPNNHLNAKVVILPDTLNWPTAHSVHLSAWLHC